MDLWEERTTTPGNSRIVAVVVCVMLVFHLIRALILVWKEIATIPILTEVESVLFTAYDRRPRIAVRNVRPTYFRVKLTAIGIVGTALSGIMAVGLYALIRPTQRDPSFVRIELVEGDARREELSYFTVVNANRVELFSLALYAHITNNSGHRLRLEDVTVEINNSAGKWERLAWVESGYGQIYQLSAMKPDMKHLVAKPISLDLIDVRARSDIDAGETISGWMFLAVAEGVNYEHLQALYRFRMVDVQGNVYQSNEVTGINHDAGTLTYADIKYLGDAIDLSQNREVIYFGENKKLN